MNECVNKPVYAHYCDGTLNTDFPTYGIFRFTYFEKNLKKIGTITFLKIAPRFSLVRMKAQ